MRLTRKSEYALMALLHLRSAKGAVPLARLARETKLPPAYLSKALQKLSRAGLVASSQGPPRRGYRLARPPGKIRVREVLEAVEGPDLFDRCVFPGRRCRSDDPCILDRQWAPLMERTRRVAEHTSLRDLHACRSRSP